MQAETAIKHSSDPHPAWPGQQREEETKRYPHNLHNQQRNHLSRGSTGKLNDQPATSHGKTEPQRSHDDVERTLQPNTAAEARQESRHLGAG